MEALGGDMTRPGRAKNSRPTAAEVLEAVKRAVIGAPGGSSAGRWARAAVFMVVIFGGGVLAYQTGFLDRGEDTDREEASKRAAGAAAANEKEAQERRAAEAAERLQRMLRA